MAYRKLKVQSLKSLQKILKQHEVPFETWGEGPTKTLKQFWKEIKEGESALALTIHGRLVRLVDRSQALIFHEGPAGRLFLRESKQVFANGSCRTRKQNISVSEKRRPEESARAAMVRGISEELGITLTDSMVLERKRGHRHSTSKSSRSYPGLSVRNRVAVFEWLMPIEHFEREGYAERQRTKTTNFDWVPV